MTLLRWERTAVFEITSLSALPSPEVELENGGGFRTLLTSNVSDWLDVTDRHRALGNSILTGIFHGASGTVKERLEKAIQEIRSSRKSPSTVALVCIATGQTHEPLEPRKFEGGIGMAIQNDRPWPAENSDAVKLRAEQILGKVLAMTCKYGTPACKARHSSLVAHDDSTGQTFNVFRLAGRAASLWIARSPDAEEIEYLKKVVSSPGVPDDVFAFISQAATQELPALEKFLAAWNALEFLLNGIWKSYAKEFNLVLESNDFAEMLISSVDGGGGVRKQSLDFRFLVCARILTPNTFAEEVNLFRNLKKFRNKLYHEGERASLDQMCEEALQLTFRLIAARFASSG